MARRRQSEPEAAAAAEVAAEPIRPEERIDPRLLLDAPTEVQQDGPEAVLDWFGRFHPGLVKSDAKVIAERENAAAARALMLARRDARRRGLPAPDPRDFFGDGYHGPAE